MNLQSIVRTILALVIIIWLANLLLGKLNHYMEKQSRSIEIIERFSITKNSSLAIVKIVNSYYLMSFSEDSNEILKEFTAEEVYEIVEVMKEQETRDPSQFIDQLDFSKWKEKYADFFNRDQD